MADPPDAAGPPHTSPAATAVRADVLRALDSALAGLPEDFRTAFVLAEIEELPLREIARIEGVAEGTVKSRVHRARQALRASLGGAFHELTNPLP
jgi:RNA polymerase sigma-70 factor (ECF subfamily)